MRVCSNCNSPVDENIKFCPMCGAALDTTQEAEKPENNGSVSNVNEEYDYQKDVEANKGIAVCSYLLILFLVPLFAAKDSKFARFHALQGAVLFGLTVVVWIFLAIVYGFFSILLPYYLAYRVYSLFRLLVSCGILVFVVLGIVNVVNGQMKKLPLIGDIIKYPK